MHREFTDAVTSAYLNARCTMNFQTISIGVHLSHARCTFIRTLKILRSERLWERTSRPVRACGNKNVMPRRLGSKEDSRRRVVVVKLL